MATRHPPREGRGRLYAAGAIAALVISLVFVGDAFLASAASVSKGPLSDSHALFGRECATCHTPGKGVPDVKCSSCHEKAGDPIGSYSFARHYVYRSTDFDRSAAESQEPACASCHVEHRGPEASLERMADAKCVSCHDTGDFRNRHPEFEFAAQSIEDPANLQFTHILHVREIVEEEQLDDIEAACLRCHRAEPDGRYFEPISFARDCDACHLTRSTATPYLPVAPPGGNVPGVATLNAIRADPEGIAMGADYWDPNEFRERSSQLQKRPVYHEDPWVLYNLNQLRGRLYPGAELADLLRASADGPLRSPRVLYEEAIATLRSRIQILSGDPSREVQDELRRLEELLETVERRLDDPYASTDESRFDVRVADRAAALETGDMVESAWLEVVDSLTSVCRTCHRVRQATIQRVQKDQRILHRAEFDHRAHIIHARCLDCHDAIPVRDFVSESADPSARLDRAEIQNVPTIATCRTCHGDDGPPDRCTSCHLFHPDRSHWSNLSRYRATR